jgi:hypothetical protein
LDYSSPESGLTLCGLQGEIISFNPTHIMRLLKALVQAVILNQNGQTMKASRVD